MHREPINALRVVQFLQGSNINVHDDALFSAGDVRFVRDVGRWGPDAAAMWAWWGTAVCLLYTDCAQNVVDIQRSTMIDVDGQDEGGRADGCAVLIPRGPFSRSDILADVDRASLLV